MSRICAFLLLIVSLPFLILAAVIHLFLYRSSPLFFQERVGYQKQLFTIVKFKTMHLGKVTFLGKVFRKLGIDELTQCWNILKGDMVFIGPRPLTQSDIDRLGWNTPENKRWNVKPGITGPAQLNKVCNAQLSLEKDNWYATHRSFRVNALLLLNSLKVPFVGKLSS